MLVAEHDAKEIISQLGGVPIPPGILVRTSETIDSMELPDGPWMVKAQVLTGKRGKQGGVLKCAKRDDIPHALQRLACLRIGANPVEWARIESQVPFVSELYFSIGIDAESGKLRMIYSEVGGIDVEDSASGTIKTLLLENTLEALVMGASALALETSGCGSAILVDAAMRIGHAFFESEAVLIEINPLFVKADATWVAGDAKLILDDGAFERHPAIIEHLHAPKERYPDVLFKFTEGFDFIVLNESGQVGLITTGAGLTMMLVDEMAEHGVLPFNFCDIRTGQIHGDPSRLITVLKMIRQAPRVTHILINVFAGITDLYNFSIRFLEAAKAVPIGDLKIIARLVGLNREKAKELLRDSALDVIFCDNLEDAIAVLRKAHA